MVMIATSAFGCGIDHSNVRSVVIPGITRSIIDFWKQAGRADPYGKEAQVDLLYHPAHEAKLGEWNIEMDCDKRMFDDFRQWVENGRQCRRIGLQKYLMGDNHRTKTYLHLVEHDEKTVHHDVCEAVGLNEIIEAASIEFNSHEEITEERQLSQLRMFQTQVENPHMDPVRSQIAHPITNKSISRLRNLRSREHNPNSSHRKLEKLNRNTLMRNILHANDPSPKEREKHRVLAAAPWERL